MPDERVARRDAPPLIFQSALPELAPDRLATGGCWGFIGPVPLPLWMSGTPLTVPSRRELLPRGHDVVVSTRIVYTDLDGTMVGPRGSFWHTAGRELSSRDPFRSQVR